MSTQMNASSQIMKENINPIYKNLYLYVPRASLRTTESQVKDQFFRSQIGNVEYCDLVTIKDKDTKQPLYAQLFIKLACWDLLSRAKADFERNGSVKIYLTDSEFWIVLPNKNPLPRTHVNTSQLAASTEKLFEQSELMEKRMESFQDEMRAEMAEMRAFMKLQQEKIEALEFKLAASEAELSYQHASKKEEEEIAEVEEKEEIVLTLPTINTEQLLPKKNVKISVLPEGYVKISDEDACIFSLNKIPRSTSPIHILSSQTEPITLADIVLQNPEKAIASRDFCGNF
jgi:hypothetical protein